MLDQALIEQLNRGYVCPLDAGPAWRAACEYGFDISLVEDAQRMTPGQKIEEHQHALNFLLVSSSFVADRPESVLWARNLIRECN